MLKPVLTIGQLRRVANIFDNAGQVLFAGSVISPLVQNFDKTKVYVVISGLIGMVSCWILSVWLESRGGKR